MVMMLKIDKNKIGDDLYDNSDDGRGDYEDLEEAHYSLQRQLRLPLSDPFWAGPPLFFNWAAIGVSLKEITYIRLIFEKKGG